MRILFCDTSFEHARRLLRKHLPDDRIWCCPRSEIGEHITEAEVAIPLMSTLDAPLLKRGKRLRLIQQFGVGLEGIDLQAAWIMGIEVANVPSEQTGNTVSVTEWVLLLMLALARDNQARQTLLNRDG